jgi:hypothetical protein
MGEQVPGSAGVFACDQIDISERLYRPQSDVLQITDRRRY